MARAHVVLSEDLLERIDRLVGARKRSEFLAQAAREKLERLELLRALDKTAGILGDETIPGWETPEDVSEWLADSRKRDDARLRRVSSDG